MVQQIAERVGHVLERRGLVERDMENAWLAGDGRRHEPVIALRAVETADFMTAHWAHLPHELLAGSFLQVLDIGRMRFSGLKPAGWRV